MYETSTSLGSLQKFEGDTGEFKGALGSRLPIILSPDISWAFETLWLPSPGQVGLKSYFDPSQTLPDVEVVPLCTQKVCNFSSLPPGAFQKVKVKGSAEIQPLVFSKVQVKCVLVLGEDSCFGRSGEVG